MNLVFFNIGWMAHYKGEDEIFGNFKYIKEHNLGHEKWNFLPCNKKCYAYVPIRWTNEETPPSINLERIYEKNNNRDELNNVTIVFISRNPTDKKTYIVGWYKNASLFRTLQLRPYQKGVLDNVYIAAVADENNCICLPLDARTFKVPTAQKEGKGKGYGMSPIWYADTEEIQEYKKEVINYIENFSLENTPERIYKSLNKQTDPEHNKQIEKIAVNTVIEYYQQQGYTVHSVESENLGYDLFVYKEDEELFVEVKGNGAAKTLIRLSPHEFDVLKENHLHYIIASVVNCDDKPILNLYNIDKKIIASEEIYYIQHTEDKDNIHELIPVTFAITSF